MSYFIFAIADLIPFIAMFGYHRGVFGHALWLPMLAMVTMLALSFHVLARDPKPDGTSIRMASFAAMLCYAGLFGLKLLTEGRGWLVSIAALIFTLMCFVVGGFAAWSVVERPTDYDVDEAE